MLRTIADFEESWEFESAATLKIFNTLTPPSLTQAVTPTGRNLGRLAWHITVTLREMMGEAGLEISGPEGNAPPPALPEIISTYRIGSHALVEAVKKKWTDPMLRDNLPMYGGQWSRGQVLASLILHQAHHRGQMTVLMRQAGLRVPGIYGPAYEDWATMNLQPQP